MKPIMPHRRWRPLMAAPSRPCASAVRSLSLGGRDGSTGPRGAQPPSRLAILPWLLCGIMLIVTVLFGYRAYRAPIAASDDGSTGTGGGEKSTTEGGSGTGTTGSRFAALEEPQVQSKGYVVSPHTVQVSPILSGRLVWVDPNLEEGRLFQLGDTLAKVEDIDYKASYERAQGVKVEAEENLKELETSLPLQIKQLEAAWQANRAKADLSARLVDNARISRSATSIEDKQKLDSGLAQDNFMNIKSEWEFVQLKQTIDRKLAQQRAKVEQARADLVRAKFLYDNCEIKAPVTGTILKKAAEKGNYVNPGAFSGSGGISVSLCDMADLSDLEIDLSIQEREISKIVEGQECMVLPEAYQNYKPYLAKYPNGYRGIVSRIIPIADRGKGSLSVRVKPFVPKEEAGMYLKPEMGVLVTFKKPVPGNWTFAPLRRTVGFVNHSTRGTSMSEPIVQVKDLSKYFRAAASRSMCSST